MALMIQRQEMSEWCWLAVAATVGDFFAGRPRSYQQCNLAQALVPIPPGTVCCSTPPAPPCNKPGPPSIALGHVGHGQTPPFVRYLAPFSRISSEITNGNPVVLAFRQTRTGVAHVVAVSAAFVSNGKQILRVDDPARGPPGRTIDYGSPVYNNIPISWEQTYFTQP
jgi:hypothetical protein